MSTKLIGRKREQEILNKALQSTETELVAVIGRRRVGKTFLIETVFDRNFDFEITGTQNRSLDIQLENFRDQLSRMGGGDFAKKRPANWTIAFQNLRDFLEQKKTDKKQILFFDELPWLVNHKSGFLEAFGYFWNSWASRRNVLVIICGSAASWMIQKVVNNKGSLHNRITKKILLKPFSLTETEHYFKMRNFHFDRYQILQIYMAMGGIPHYLKEVENGKSAIQNIDLICFSDDGLLKDEFSRLYPALFDNADNHIAIIRALAAKNRGLSRLELISATKLSDGGGLTKTLDELIHSGFISPYFPFGKKKKEKLFRLTDEYSLFYLKFIENKIYQELSVWQKLSQTQIYKTWSGYAYENICLKHVPQIKKALDIAGIYSQSASFYKKGSKQEKGAQIDLVIDRNDHVINLFEVKFYKDVFSITKDYAQSLREKMGVFRFTTKTKKQLFYVLITTFGLKKNEHSTSIISNDLVLDDLFE